MRLKVCSSIWDTKFKAQSPKTLLALVVFFSFVILEPKPALVRALTVCPSLQVERGKLGNVAASLQCFVLHRRTQIHLPMCIQTLLADILEWTFVIPKIIDTFRGKRRRVAYVMVFRINQTRDRLKTVSDVSAKLRNTVR